MQYLASLLIVMASLVAAATTASAGKLSDAEVDDLVKRSYQWLQSFKEFPPRQKPGSFNLDRVMEAVTAGSQGNQ